MLTVRILRFAAASSSLLLAWLLPIHAALAEDSSPVRFRAVSLGSATTAGHAPAAGAPGDDTISFAAFELLQPAANLRLAIQQLEEQGDYATPRLAELSFELGKALHAEGRYREAEAAHSRAQQILRQQDGLYSAAQIPVLQARSESLLALGDLPAADELKHSVLDLQERNRAGDAIGLAAARLEWADWNLRYYLDMKQRVVPGGRGEAEEDALAARLGLAFRYYHQALALVADRDGMDEWKIDVERRIAALTLMANREYQRNMPTLLAKHGLRSRQAEQRSNHRLLTDHGSTALQRAIDHSVLAQDAEGVALRMLELGDWYLLLNRFDEAHAYYTEARARLLQAGIPAERQSRILQAGLPVHDPAAELSALVLQDDDTAWDGYIDVSFDLDRSGKASAPRILASSIEDTAVEQQLLRRIRNDAFRPLYIDAAADAGQQVTLRYFYSR